VIDVRRFRPLVTVVLTVLVIFPSFIEMATQGLAATTVLQRLVEALGIASVLVWVVSGVVLHYAKVQSELSAEDRETGQFQR
jgi:amino acid permease